MSTESAVVEEFSLLNISKDPSMIAPSVIPQKAAGMSYIPFEEGGILKKPWYFVFPKHSAIVPTQTLVQILKDSVNQYIHNSNSVAKSVPRQFASGLHCMIKGLTNGPDKVFIRPCPFTPNHGMKVSGLESFSISLDNAEQVIETVKKTLNLLGDKEALILMKDQEALVSGVMTYNGIAIGKSNDGITAGHGYSIAVEASEDLTPKDTTFVDVFKSFEVEFVIPKFSNSEANPLSLEGSPQIIFTQSRRSNEGGGIVFNDTKEKPFKNSMRMIVPAAYKNCKMGLYHTGLIIVKTLDDLAKINGHEKLVWAPEGSPFSHAAAHCKAGNHFYMYGNADEEEVINLFKKGNPFHPKFFYYEGFATPFAYNSDATKLKEEYFKENPSFAKVMYGESSTFDAKISDKIKEAQSSDLELCPEEYAKGFEVAIKHLQKEAVSLGYIYHRFIAGENNLSLEDYSFISGMFSGTLVKLTTAAALGESRHMAGRSIARKFKNDYIPANIANHIELLKIEDVLKFANEYVYVPGHSNTKLEKISKKDRPSSMFWAYLDDAMVSGSKVVVSKLARELFKLYLSPGFKLRRNGKPFLTRTDSAAGTFKQLSKAILDVPMTGLGRNEIYHRVFTVPVSVEEMKSMLEFANDALDPRVVAWDSGYGGLNWKTGTVIAKAIFDRYKTNPEQAFHLTNLLEAVGHNGGNLFNKFSISGTLDAITSNRIIMSDRSVSHLGFAVYIANNLEKYRKLNDVPIKNSKPIITFEEFLSEMFKNQEEGIASIRKAELISGVKIIDLQDLTFDVTLKQSESNRSLLKSAANIVDEDITFESFGMPTEDCEDDEEESLDEE